MAELGLFFDGFVERLCGAHIVVVIVIGVRLVRARIGTPHVRSLSRHEESYLDYLVRLTF